MSSIKYYRINYRKNYYTTDYKLTKSELGETDAINKTKLKHSRITEVFELTKEEYEHYKQKQNERKEAKKLYDNNRFIQ